MTGKLNSHGLVSEVTVALFLRRKYSKGERRQYSACNLYNLALVIKKTAKIGVVKE